MSKRSLFDSAMQWGASFIVHLLLIAVLASFYVETERAPQRAKVLTDMTKLSEPLDFQDMLLPDEAIDLEAAVSLSPAGGTGALANATAVSNPIESATQMAAATSALGDRRLLRPLAMGAGELQLDSGIKGLKGINEISSGLGDEGSVDRITLEILRQLDKNKVLVAWILDASASLDERRDAIAKRFDRIYKELDELGVNESDALLTSVVSVGQSTRYLLDRPTNDVEEIRKAIGSVKDDKTGAENLFTAVRETALKYRRFQTSGRRTLMLVLLTDEIGDDTAAADDTVTLLKRNNVPLYVMGTMATFSRPVLHDTWVDPETKYTFWIDLRRGPYTREEEILRVPFNSNAYLSGFGAFALTQMTRETGGIFFIYNDARVSGPDYDTQILMRYKADYDTAQEYAKQIGSSSFRHTLVEVVNEGNAMWGPGWPYGWIHANAWKEDLEARQRDIARFIVFANRAIPRLEAIEKEWQSETHPRWRAAYDLTFARLLQAKVRADEFNWTCADFKVNPLTLQDPKKNNGWHYRLTDQIRIDQKPGERLAKDEKDAKSKPSPAVAKGGSSAGAEARSLLERSLALYKRVIDQHPDTPFAVAAAAENNRLVGFDWQEGYDHNYTLTPEQRKAYQEAAQRVPKR